MPKKNINKKIVTDKISKILAYIEEIKPILELSPRHILDKNNYIELRTLERNLQLIVDTMIEINSHFIAKLNLSIPENYANTFILLGNNKVLPFDFASRIAKVVGLRNKIVHMYDVVDMKKFIADLKKNSGQFKAYTRHIHNYIKDMKDKNIKLDKKTGEKIGKKYGLRYLILFGSRAESGGNVLSDYDIAYSSSKNINYGDEVFLAEDLGKALKINPEKIDLVNTKNAGPLLAKEIAYNGKLLAEFTPNSFDNYQIYAFMIYIEAKPLFKMQADYVRRNLPKR